MLRSCRDSEFCMRKLDILFNASFDLGSAEDVHWILACAR